jgi:hypothetical protein
LDLWNPFSEEAIDFGDSEGIIGKICAAYLASIIKYRFQGRLLQNSPFPSFPESGNPGALKTGFRVALCLPGMTTFHTFQDFCRRLKGNEE